MMANNIAKEDQGRTRGSNIYHIGDGLFYVLRELRGTRARLRCHHYMRGCTGTAVIRFQTDQPYHLQPHNHRPDLLLLEDLQMRREMVAHASQNYTGRTATQILHDWKSRCRNPQLAMRFTSVRMRSALNEARSSNYPCIPRTLAGLGILLGLPNMRAITETVDGTDIVFQGMVGFLGDKTLSLVFVSGRMLQFLQGRSNLHLDGTFKKRPRIPESRQIYNIVTNYGGNVICILRALMMSRTEQAYVTLLEYIKDLACNLRPQRIHCDFERGQINAVERVFTGSAIYGCQWHFGVDFRRKARLLGLVPLATDDEKVYSIIRCLCALPLLPCEYIWDTVLALWAEVLVYGLVQELRPLFDYFKHTWRPLIEELSVFNCPERTNNVSESDNHMLSSVLPQNHPSVWQLIGGFVRLEHLAWLDKMASDDGRQVNGSRSYAAIFNDSRIRRWSILLVNRDINPLQFLHAVSWSVVAAVNHGLRVDDSSDSESDNSEDEDE